MSAQPEDAPEPDLQPYTVIAERMGVQVGTVRSLARRGASARHPFPTSRPCPLRPHKMITHPLSTATPCPVCAGRGRVLDWHEVDRWRQERPGRGTNRSNPSRAARKGWRTRSGDTAQVLGQCVRECGTEIRVGDKAAPTPSGQYICEQCYLAEGWD